jgi:hypothetical protein
MPVFGCADTLDFETKIATIVNSTRKYASNLRVFNQHYKANDLLIIVFS